MLYCMMLGMTVRWTELGRGLPKTPCMFNASELSFAIVHRMDGLCFAT